MFPRILVFCFIINRELLPQLAWPVAVMTVLLYGPAIVIWRRHAGELQVSQPRLSQNPLELTSALMFGLLLTAILVLGEWLERGLGDTGIYVLAASSGMADVDAITLSLTRMSTESLAMETAVIGIVIAATVNNLVKTALAWGVGNRRTGLMVAGPMLVSLSAGLAVAWFQAA